MDNQTQNSEKEVDLILETWNIITIIMQKMNEIAAELSEYKFDIIALQEIR